MLDKKKREQFHRVLDLVLDINGFEARKQNETGCKPTVFFEYSGHIAEVKVDVHSRGWKPDDTPDFRESFYVSDDECVGHLETMVKDLERINNEANKAKEMTIAEIEKALGYKISIVGDN